MKSYERQGIDQIPTVHMGPAVSAMERRGIETDIGNLNREIRKTNALIATIKRAITRIKV
ncbi:MAG: MobA/MobL family protein [Acetivibrionales bacterium]